MAETEADKVKQMVVLLIRPPGRGKSKLCDTVMRSESRPWSCICQARKHVLIVARQEGLDRLEDVGRENIQLLQEMHNVGLKWVEKCQEEDASLIFRLGYHLVPSMKQLHLLVISQDFESDHLKNKKHKKHSVDVLEEIKSLGKATMASEDLFEG